MTTLAEPAIFLAGRPFAKGTTDARRFRFAAFLLFFKLALGNDDRIVGDRIHAVIWNRFRPQENNAGWLCKHSTGREHS